MKLYRSMVNHVMLVAVLALLTVGQQAAAATEADTVYKSGVVYTVDDFYTSHEAFAVKDGKFVAIGSDKDMKAYTGKNTKVVNLRGKMAMPGLADNHIHALRGALTSLGLSFPATSTVPEIKAAVKTAIADRKLKKGEWLEGAKWSVDYTTLTAAMLDEVAPDNPVFLHDWTNHLGWVNSAALKAAGINKSTPDPVGGVVDRDADGNPTGTLHDKALGLITAVMPTPPDEVVEKRAEWIFAKLSKYGITNIQTAQLDPMRIKAYRALEKKGRLNVRIQGSWDFNTRYVTTTLEEQSKTFMTRKARGENSSLINVDAVKIYMDGVPNDSLEGGSPMIDSYATGKTFGTPSIDEATFTTWMRLMDEQDLKVMAHATGSLSVRVWLNAIEATRRANGKGPRHHLAHSMMIYPEDYSRFDINGSNFTTEVSPYQLWVPDPAMIGWSRQIGRERFNETMTPLRSITDEGAIVVYGSDWDNIAEPDPWFALEGMITRAYPGRPEFGAMNPDERLTREQAIRVFTMNGAINLSKEDETGSIEVGKSADFIVINQNILDVPVTNIHKTKVLKTVLQGRTVYEGK